LPDPVLVPSSADDIVVDELSKVHGPAGTGVDDDAERFTVVVVGDGFEFEETDQVRFSSAVDAIVAVLNQTSPFSDPDLVGAINLWKVVPVPVGQGVPRGWTGAASDLVVSGERGQPLADMTVAPEDTPTLFGSAHPEVGNGMSWNRDLLRDFAERVRPAFDAAIIVVNSFRHGGTRSRNTAVVTLHATAPVFLHELGHILGLADEYDSSRADRRRPRRHHLLSNSPSETPVVRYVAGVGRAATIGQPHQANVAYRRRLRRFLVPWRSELVRVHGRTLEGVPIVRREEDSCDTRDTRLIGALDVDGDPAASVDDETFGMFEGAHLYRCGAWRSQFECMMRTAGNPFCVACRLALRRALLPYVDP